MISRLRGILLDKQSEPLNIEMDVQGVAYEMQTSLQTFYQLPAIGHTLTLYTHMVVREDAHQLFAFHNEAERRLFRILLKASGIGPKLALAILSNIIPETFVTCIRTKAYDSLLRIPGLGKKTVDRLTLEIRDRLNDWPVSLPETPSATAPLSTAPLQEALSALLALGYKPAEATRVLQTIGDKANNTEDYIRHALKYLGETQAT